MKKCPYCAEEVQDAAIVCKHCKHDLSQSQIMVNNQEFKKELKEFESFMASYGNGWFLVNKTKDFVSYQKTTSDQKANCLIAFILLCLFLVPGVLYLYFSSKRGQTHQITVAVNSDGFLVPSGDKTGLHIFNLYLKSSQGVNAKTTSIPNDKEWYKQWWAVLLWIFLGLSLLSGIIQSFTSTGQVSVNTQNANGSQKNINGNLKGVGSLPIINSVFDIPSLLDKNIDEIVKILGKANSSFTPTPLQLDMGISEADMTWKKDSTTLIVKYNINTNKIIDFFLTDNNTSNKDGLTSLGNLNIDDPRYSVEFVSSNTVPNTYTGVIVKAK